MRICFRRSLPSCDETSIPNVLDSEPEGLFLSSVLPQVDLVNGLSGWIVYSSQLSRFRYGVSFGMDEIDEVFSLIVGHRLILFSHGAISVLKSNLKIILRAYL